MFPKVTIPRVAVDGAGRMLMLMKMPIAACVSQSRHRKPNLTKRSGLSTQTSLYLLRFMSGSSVGDDEGSDGKKYVHD